MFYNEKEIIEKILILQKHLTDKRKNQSMSIIGEEIFHLHFFQNDCRDTLSIVTEDNRNGVSFTINRFDEVRVLSKEGNIKNIERLFERLNEQHLSELADKHTTILK